MGIIAVVTARLTKRAVVNGIVANIGIQPGDDQLHFHAQRVAVRTYHWVPPRPPMPETCRRMLRHNAIKARDKMLNTVWRRCRAPVR